MEGLFTLRDDLHRQFATVARKGFQREGTGFVLVKQGIPEYVRAELLDSHLHGDFLSLVTTLVEDYTASKSYVLVILIDDTGAYLGTRSL